MKWVCDYINEEGRVVHTCIHEFNPDEDTDIAFLPTDVSQYVCMQCNTAGSYFPGRFECYNCKSIYGLEQKG